ncbi:uncharacterized protein LOC116165862 [Photinus pyralis]|uniref:uncharacterized protein LOC116165862 n=1 Tax=Photinus pyralis TaxID=7054 RepID=UPI00126719DE|nr:uncharacterized protein LOC116165862 [Photinus pyralis]
MNNIRDLVRSRYVIASSCKNFDEKFSADILDNFSGDVPFDQINVVSVSIHSPESSWKKPDVDVGIIYESQLRESSLHKDKDAIPLHQAGTLSAFNQSIPSLAKNHDVSKTILPLNESKATMKNCVIIRNTTWNKMYDLKNNVMKSGWTDHMNKYFEKIFPLCVLKFKFHRINKPKRPGKITFLAKAECKHSKCAKFTFFCTENLALPNDKEINIVKVGIIQHFDEAHRRFIKGSHRAKLGRELLYTTPGILKLKKLDACDNKVLLAGNLNYAPDSVILRKISSEQHKKYDLDKDPFLHLQKLQTYLKKIFPGKKIPGYINFMKYLLESVLTYYPIISGLIIKKLGYIRDNNGVVESWFRIVKKDIFLGKMRNLAARYIRRMSELITPRLIHEKVPLKATRKGKKSKVTTSNKIKSTRLVTKSSKHISKGGIKVSGDQSSITTKEEEWGKRTEDINKYISKFSVAPQVIDLHKNFLSSTLIPNKTDSLIECDESSIYLENLPPSEFYFEFNSQNAKNTDSPQKKDSENVFEQNISPGKETYSDMRQTVDLDIFSNWELSGFRNEATLQLPILENHLVDNINYYIHRDFRYIVGIYTGKTNCILTEIDSLDFASLDSNKWITNQVIDICLDLIIGKMTNIKYVSTQIDIFTRETFPKIEPTIEKFLYVVHENQNHWCLIYADLVHKKFYYMIPLKIENWKRLEHIGASLTKF